MLPAPPRRVGPAPNAASTVCEPTAPAADCHRCRYFNIVFDSAEAQAKGGHFNQFVPQLMLGGCLTNSTGPPDYQVRAQLAFSRVSIRSTSRTLIRREPIHRAQRHSRV